MISNKNKMVRFDLYCINCEHAKTPQDEKPCNECLRSPVNVHSSKPINYKEKKYRK